MGTIVSQIVRFAVMPLVLIVVFAATGIQWPADIKLNLPFFLGVMGCLLFAASLARESERAKEEAESTDPGSSRFEYEVRACGAAVVGLFCALATVAFVLAASPAHRWVTIGITAIGVVLSCWKARTWMRSVRSPGLPPPSQPPSPPPGPARWKQAA